MALLADSIGGGPEAETQASADSTPQDPQPSGVSEEKIRQDAPQIEQETSMANELTHGKINEPHLEPTRDVEMTNTDPVNSATDLAPGESSQIQQPEDRAQVEPAAEEAEWEVDSSPIESSDADSSDDTS